MKLFYVAIFGKRCFIFQHILFNFESISLFFSTEVLTLEPKCKYKQNNRKKLWTWIHFNVTVLVAQTIQNMLCFCSFFFLKTSHARNFTYNCTSGIWFWFTQGKKKQYIIPFWHIQQTNDIKRPSKEERKAKLVLKAMAKGHFQGP